MTLNTSIHRNLLLQILKDIYGDPEIAPLLGFKGGTAAYLFYDLSRFSVDLDFDIIDTTKKEPAPLAAEVSPSRVENLVFKKIENILKNYGKIKDKAIKRFSLFFLLSYEDKAHNIKIEINRRSFGSNYELKSYLGVSMLVMVKEDMFAHKLVAMLERIGKTNRDIFDVWFFLKNNWPINEKIILDRTGMMTESFLKKCIKSLEKLGDRSILAGMGEILDEKQKDWVKAKLRSDTIFLLKTRLGK